jgi:ABC-type branched-subunit amino acid transport system ATPase component
MDIVTSKEERRFLPMSKARGLRAAMHMTETVETAAPVDWSAGQTPLLELRGVNKSFGGLVAVGDLDLQVNKGEIISIIGPNGAGKTTVFNLVTGLYKPNDFLAGKANRFVEQWKLVGRRLALIIRQRPLSLLWWIVKVLLGVAIGALFIRYVLNVFIDAALQEGFENYLGPTVNVSTIVWVIFWPLNRFANFFQGPANGYWAELDHEDTGVSGFQGAIRLEGGTLLGVTPDVVLTRGVARTYQNIRLFNNMTVLENVLVGQHARLKSNLLGMVLRTPGVNHEEAKAKAKAIELLSFFGTELVERQDEVVSNLAYAQKRRVEICRALASDPKLLLLDEPTAGMNDAETAEAVNYIRRLRDERGLTILLIEHKLTVTMGISDRITVLDYGRKIAEGLPDDVRNNERVIEAYLGRKTTVA